MKSFAIVFSHLTSPARRRNLLVLGKLLVLFLSLVALFSITFHYLMELEGRSFSWVTSVYWTLTVMSTLGFGDITFHSDAGRVFSVIVLLTGTIFLLVLLPFMFIQFFYVPWMEAQAAARAPRELPEKVRDHVLLTGLGPVERALIKVLDRSSISYAVVVPDLTEALSFHDQGFKVILGELDDPDTYRRARVEDAALVATMRADTTNANVAFTVREVSPSVPIVGTAAASASVDILELAGCTKVLELGETLGKAFARRVLGRDARSHTIGHFGRLEIAEASAAGTTLVGRTIRDCGIREKANVNVVGVWERGKFVTARPETTIQESSILVLAGSPEQIQSYDAAYGRPDELPARVVIIGGGRVGRALGRVLAAKDVDYRIVERVAERVRDRTNYVVGDAAELEVLLDAGIVEASSVVITTHDDDMNVYLTIYCRKLRPDIQILGRVNLERNINTLHRAGADFVMSYASTGANLVYNLLQKRNILLLAEGLDIFRVPVPEWMANRSLIECDVRRSTGCNVIALVEADSYDINPDAHRALPPTAELIVVGDVEAEGKFMKKS